MSDDNEIEFEGVDSQIWQTVVRQTAINTAKGNLQQRWNAADQATAEFKEYADQMVAEAITKPPGRTKAFGSLVDLVAAACEFMLPEDAAVHKVFEKAKSIWEGVKAAGELAEPEEIEGESIEKAKKELTLLCDKLISAIKDNAGDITNIPDSTLGEALDEYVQQNPQDFTNIDDSYYQTLCDAIGVTAPDVHALQGEIVNTVMPIFRERVEWIKARIHFFFELDVFGQLDFLIDRVIEIDGNNPDEFLDRIGGDVGYWEQFLSVYRSDGKPAAKQALALSIGLLTPPLSNLLAPQNGL